MSYTSTTHHTTYPTLSSFSSPPSTVLITGSGSGIGAATALSFARAGATSLILLGRRADRLASTAQAIASAHPSVRVTVHAADVLSLPALREIFSTTKIDAVVHAAGVLLPLVPLADQDPDAVWANFETNLRGALNVATEYARSLAQDGRRGVFVDVNSAGVVMPAIPGVGAYIGAKLALVKTLEYVGLESGGRLRVVHVHPGVIKTGMADIMEEAGMAFQYDDGEFTLGLVRWGEMGGVMLTRTGVLVSLPADFMVWAASEEAAFLKDRFVFAHWDVDELKARKEEIQKGELSLGLVGFPRQA
jgi:NAD(P)-dependent dehydrogenase (short-subunit alcohol dehydrogenase family)